MSDIVAPPKPNLTRAPDESKLDALLGKTIKDLCPHDYANDHDNHCAHFVSHVLDLAFGATCRMMAKKAKPNTPGANIRVQQLFAKCPKVGKWSDRDPNGIGCLAFVTREKAVNVEKREMTNIPKKHVGIFLNGKIWHYSNSKDKVVRIPAEDFKHHYPGKGFAVFYGTFPQS